LAEEGDSAILRLYEPPGARGECTLRFGRPIERVERVNFLEEAAGPVELQGGAVSLGVRPFEVVTLRMDWERD
jgi:alpha-mannosidase